jgi:DNA-binding NtrC family response regulator
LAKDANVLLGIARMNELKKDWPLALSCLEAAAALGDGLLRRRIAETAARIGQAVKDRPELFARARSLATDSNALDPTEPPPSAGEGRASDDDSEPSAEESRTSFVRPAAPGRLESGGPAFLAESVLTRLADCELDLSSAAGLALDLVLEATHAVRGCILVRDTGGRLELFRGRGIDRNDVSPALSTAVLAEVERSGRPVLLADAAKDPRFKERKSVEEHGLRSVACVPIFEKTRGATLGVVYLDDPRKGGRFDGRARELVGALARAIAPSLRNALRFESQRRALMAARVAPRPTIVGRSPAIRRVVELLAKLGPAPAPVLIVGESGTGKELVARALHDLSPRRSGPFIAESLVAVPESLLQGELFGVCKGAFTGADSDRDGLFVKAHGGTLFLDEIGELSLEVQAQLLRVLQEREVRPLGGDRVVRVDCRVAAATNRELGSLVREGKMREDLLYRLKVLEVRMPPLRERMEDLPLLCEHILQRIALELGETPFPLSLRAMGRLARHHWPGNVRELEGVLWRVALGGEDVLNELQGASCSPAGKGLGISVTLGPEEVSLEDARVAFDRAYLQAVLGRQRGARRTGGRGAWNHAPIALAGPPSRGHRSFLARNDATRRSRAGDLLKEHRAPTTVPSPCLGGPTRMHLSTCP